VERVGAVKGPLKLLEAAAIKLEHGDSLAIPWLN
jgi:hypothetical protein